MDVKILTLPAHHVAYLRHTGGYDHDGIAAAWQQLSQWCAAQHFADGRHHMFGVSWDNPQHTPPQLCRYDACVEVAADYPVSAPLAVQRLPGGLYACVNYRGRAQDIGPVWQYLCGPWLASSGYRFDARPSFEFYPRDVDIMPEEGIFFCQVCLAISPAPSASNK